jgi:hypothetical protein
MWFSKKKSREEIILDTLREMTAQFSASMQHQADTHLESIKTIAAANIEVSKGLGEQAKSFSNWIDSFKIDAKPEARVMDDDTMVALQNERLKKSGFPVDSSQRDQMTFTATELFNLEKIEAEMFGGL